ncbi:unnamed protein product [Citrullus colocynthis]|uniref:Transposase MuDR plant domain-containing protein n=1 Tax=Citrullus colocynthis TaxID=252529 RepID=A0ABP0Y514_9ROSI
MSESRSGFMAPIFLLDGMVSWVDIQAMHDYERSTLKDVVVYIENDAGRNGNSRREGQKIVEMDIESVKDLDSEELHSLNDSSDSDQGCNIKFPSFRQDIEENCMINFEIEGCKWVAYASKIQGEETFQLKTYVNEHTCSRCFRNPRLTSSWLSKQLTNEVKDHPEMKLTSIQDKEYCEELRKSDPDSTATLSLKMSQEEEENEGEFTGRIRSFHTFQRLYICLEHVSKVLWRGVDLL